jgi:hypothetical protein
MTGDCSHRKIASTEMANDAPTQKSGAAEDRDSSSVIHGACSSALLAPQGN